MSLGSTLFSTSDDFLSLFCQITQLVRGLESFVVQGGKFMVSVFLSGMKRVATGQENG